MDVTAVAGQVLRRAILSCPVLKALLLLLSLTASAVSASESRQVEFHMRFLEVDRNDVFDLGVQRDASIHQDRIVIGLPSDDAALDANIDQFVETSEKQGRINSLAEPHMMAFEGESANFQVGIEVPISNADDGSKDVEFRTVGMSVDLVPTLTDDDRLNVQVRPKSVMVIRSDGTSDVQRPAIITKAAEATLDLASGQSFAIAGLFDHERSFDTDMFPILAELPVFGPLATSERFKRKETELIVLITARLAS